MARQTSIGPGPGALCASQGAIANGASTLAGSYGAAANRAGTLGGSQEPSTNGAGTLGGSQGAPANRAGISGGSQRATAKSAGTLGRSQGAPANGAGTLGGSQGPTANGAGTLGGSWGASASGVASCISSLSHAPRRGAQGDNGASANTTGNASKKTGKTTRRKLVHTISLPHAPSSSTGPGASHAPAALPNLGSDRPAMSQVCGGTEQVQEVTLHTCRHQAWLWSVMTLHHALT